MKKIFTKLDIFIWIILLLLGLALSFFILGQPLSSEVTASDLELWVIEDNQVIGRYPLDQDTLVEVGEGAHNKFQIKGGRVSMVEADCGDQTCVKMGEISKINETIVCLPHKLVLKISSKEKEGEVDIIAK
ncbi:MAG: NusG domain II-containing protein [Eubacterium sp.]|nr:NusG domain II-containing protein [Eubacterium sp.]